MNTSLGFCGRNTLYTVNAGFIFQNSINAFACYAEDDFLESADGTFRETAHSHLPAFQFYVLAVHTEQVAGKQGSFITTCTASDFHDDVLVVFGVGRDEQQFYFLFQCRDSFLAFCHFLAQHLLRVGIFLYGKHLLGILDILQTTHVFLPGGNDFAKVLIFLGQFYVTLLVGNYGRVRDKRTHFLVSGNKSFQSV